MHLAQLHDRVRRPRPHLLVRFCVEFPEPIELTRDCSYGLFKAADKKLLDADNLTDRLSTVDKIVKE